MVAVSIPPCRPDTRCAAAVKSWAFVAKQFVDVCVSREAEPKVCVCVCLCACVCFMSAFAKIVGAINKVVVL